MLWDSRCKLRETPALLVLNCIHRIAAQRWVPCDWSRMQARFKTLFFLTRIIVWPQLMMIQVFRLSESSWNRFEQYRSRAELRRDRLPVRKRTKSINGNRLFTSRGSSVSISASTDQPNTQSTTARLEQPPIERKLQRSQLRLSTTLEISFLLLANSKLSQTTDSIWVFWARFGLFTEAVLTRRYM